MKTSKKGQKTKQAILDSLAVIFKKLSVEDALKVEAYALIATYPWVDLPTEAPEFYMDRRDKTESAVDFTRRVYGDYLGRGLAKVNLRHMDRSLYNALNTWLVENGALPDDFDLPTRAETATRQLEDLKNIHSPSVAGAVTSSKEIGRVFANMDNNMRKRRNLNK